MTKRETKVTKWYDQNEDFYQAWYTGVLISIMSKFINTKNIN